MHEEPEFLKQAAILFGTALAVAWAFRYLRAPSIIGFLITGLVIGPSTLNLIDEHQVHTFAEVGLVLLLFTIGLELSPAPLLKAGPRLLGATGLQIAATAIVPVVLVALFTDFSLSTGIILGIAVSLSSTAIVLKTLSDRHEVGTAVGNISTGVLLLQDVFVIIVMLLLPFVANSAEGGVGSALLQAGGGLLVLGIIAAAARLVLPSVLAQITRHGGLELTSLFAVVMAAGGAWVTSTFGWPPALGACIAGLLLAGADLRHQLTAEITPFRDVFNALFFISLGMLVDLDFVIAHWWQLGIAIGAALLYKAVAVAGAVRAGGWPGRVAIQAGLTLCTVSEFGYVLAAGANGLNLLPDSALTGLIPFAVGTMLAGAILVPISGTVAAWMTGGRATDESGSDAHSELGLQSHVIIVGFGTNGLNLTRVLKATGIAHCVVEMNPRLIREARGVDAVVVNGDATRSAILHSADIAKARALVVAINDDAATRKIVAQARSMRPDLFIIARTWHASEFEPLKQRGASVVVPADFEVSIKIFAQVLDEFRVPDNMVQAQIAAIRAGGYGVLRGESSSKPEALEELVGALRLTATQTYYLDDKAYAAGKTIIDLNLRAKTGVSIIAVVRKGDPLANPSADTQLEAGDVLVLVGSHAQLDEALQLLREG